MTDLARIRNFAIVAHIDHGKSTLADRFIEMCGGLDARQIRLRRQIGLVEQHHVRECDLLGGGAHFFQMALGVLEQRTSQITQFHSDILKLHTPVITCRTSVSRAMDYM